MPHFNASGNKSFVSSYDFSNNNTATSVPLVVVKLDSNGQVTPATAVSDRFIGVVQDMPKVGWNADVRLLSAPGTISATAGGTVNAGDLLTVNASGQVVTSTTAADHIVGQALESGVSGKVIEFVPSAVGVQHA